MGTSEVMNLRRLVLLIGAVALVAGVIGLLVPVSATGGGGEKVGCGNAVVADLSAAADAETRSGGNIPIIGQLVPGNDYVAACESALSSRRAWAIPVAVIGLIAVAGSFVIGGRSGRRVAM